METFSSSGDTDVSKEYRNALTSAEKYLDWENISNVK
jgi:hypothetical protein